jgi:hypothetical protein
VHRGPILDRLDCACPRRWIRECERHKTCTIDTMSEGDERRPALRLALERLGISEPMVCAKCPDFQPEYVVD